MKKINKDLLTLKTTLNIVFNDFRGLFDLKSTAKLFAAINEIDSTATMSSKIHEKSRWNYDNITMWLQAVNLCHNQNQIDIHDYMKDQAINQHRSDYKLLSP